MRDDQRHLIVFVANPVLAGGIPDERLLRDIERVQREHGTLTFVFHIGEQMPAALPEQLVPVLAAIDPDVECDHHQSRELPKAFLRRSMTLVLAEPDADGLTAIALAHAPQAEPARVRAIVEWIIELRDKADEHGLRPPGTSEFLDAVRTCEELQISVDGADLWRQIEGAVLLKPTI